VPDIAEPTPVAEKKKPPIPRDPAREIVETIVFVVVLVLLLKLFVTEAFVIPTGSMAETLYGYQKIVKCEACEHQFPVNSHDEVEGRDGRRTALTGYCCPNCRHVGRIQDLNPIPTNSSGDRVLVLKPLFHIRDPKRGDVVVFKYPDKPQEKFTAQNYIKRAMGFGTESLAIYRGDLYVTRGRDYPPDALNEMGEPLYPRPADPLEYWKPEYMYRTVTAQARDTDGKPLFDHDGVPRMEERPNPLAGELFDTSRGAGFPAGGIGFEIVVKGEEQMLADRRLVWDNDKQPRELAEKLGKAYKSRWYAVPLPPAKPGDPVPWNGDNEFQPKAFARNEAVPGMHWIRYRHMIAQWKTSPPDASDSSLPTDLGTIANQTPVPIDNFLGYNAGIPSGGTPPGTGLWVGDLILECEVTAVVGGKVVLELSKGVNRFRATFTDGTVTLSRIGSRGEEFGNPSRPYRFKAGKEQELRFANVDCRLWVWVDGKRIDFGPEGDYPAARAADEKDFDDKDERDGKEVKRTGVYAEGYTYVNDILAPASIGGEGAVTIRKIKLHRDVYYTRDQRRGSFDHAKADTFYVQPGHYMCMGDNSASSSDSRNWGVVPERLMLGKAVFVFWPGWAPSRIGFIK